MASFLDALLPYIALMTTALFVVAVLVWLFPGHGLDKLRHFEEWKDLGKSGERIAYITLLKKIHIPENQIFRNVYIPTADGKTSEIDLLVVSKKGLLVFECKNYAGNIYGDMKYDKWIQYLGKKKSYFYNPILQNRSHAKHLKKFLVEFGDLPVIPLVATIARGKWKVKNLGKTDYLLGYNCHLKDILDTTPDSELMAKHFRAILRKLTPLSRPGEDIEKKHVEQIRNG